MNRRGGSGLCGCLTLAPMTCIDFFADDKSRPAQCPLLYWSLAWRAPGFLFFFLFRLAIGFESLSQEVLGTWADHERERL